MTQRELDKGDIIALKKEGEQEMAQLVCPECMKAGRANQIGIACSGDITIDKI